MNFLVEGYKRWLQPQAQATATAELTAELEVAAVFDGFTSLEDIAADLTGDELLAATWGLPYETPSPQPQAQKPAEAETADPAWPLAEIELST